MIKKFDTQEEFEAYVSGGLQSGDLYYVIDGEKCYFRTNDIDGEVRDYECGGKVVEPEYLRTIDVSDNVSAKYPKLAGIVDAYVENIDVAPWDPDNCTFSYDLTRDTYNNYWDESVPAYDFETYNEFPYSWNKNSLTVDSDTVENIYINTKIYPPNGSAVETGRIDLPFHDVSIVNAPALKGIYCADGIRVQVYGYDPHPDVYFGQTPVIEHLPVVHIHKNQGAYDYINWWDFAVPSLVFVEGIKTEYDIDLSRCSKLTTASVRSIVENLLDLSDTDDTHTLRLWYHQFNSIPSELVETATAKGWTITA